MGFEVRLETEPGERSAAAGREGIELKRGQRRGGPGGLKKQPQEAHLLRAERRSRRGHCGELTPGRMDRWHRGAPLTQERKQENGRSIPRDARIISCKCLARERRAPA